MWRERRMDLGGLIFVHTKAPFAFVRPPGQGVLPNPIMPSDEHAAREALRASLAATGARSNRSAVTLFTWWLGALSPRGPYAPLIIRGSCGTGKTVLGRLAIRMIDPHRAEMQRMPSLEDLPIAIEAAHVWGFDNLSRLDQEHSDALCCLATGDAVLRRSLYTDRELTVFEASRPVLITSITDAATAPDLLDRSLVISLDRLTERKGEDEIFEHWRKCWPSGFGALLWFAAQAMVRAPASEPPAELRMRDIARRAAAVEQAAGFPAGAVYAAFAASREDAIDVSVTDPLVAPLLAVVKAGGGKWEGTADELLADLREQAEQAMRAVKSPRGLVAALARLEPQLAELGLTWARARSAERRELHFQSVRAQAPADRSLAGWMEEDFDAH